MSGQGYRASTPPTPKRDWRFRQSSDFQRWDQDVRSHQAKEKDGRQMRTANDEPNTRNLRERARNIL